MELDKITDDPQLGQLLQRATELKAAIDEGRVAGDAVAELKANYQEVRDQINVWQTAENERTAKAEIAQIRVDLDNLLQRQPSKAALINNAGPSFTSSHDPMATFFTTVAAAHSRDYSSQTAAKAALEAMGAVYMVGEGKATVGDTNAAGGFIVPNAVVRDIDFQATAPRSAVDLATQVNGVNGNSVQIPFEQGVPTRAIIAAANTLKENQDFIVGAYTATLYTLARIFDVSNQLLRQSGGAAETIVRSRLARAFGLGEDYYFLSGSGSSQPYGLLTAIGTAGPYVTSFSPSATTLAGSVPSALATLGGVLANRGAVPDGAIMNSADYWVMLAQGTDTAGFFLAPSDGPTAINPASVGVTSSGPFGMRIRHSPNMTTDNLVVGEFRDLYFFRGQGYQVDVSDQAGTRWDYNLTGFRGEEEIAFDARPSVYTGHFQRITNLLA